MATLLDYRRRIRSVKSTQQITRAMKFVAAAKLRRAQEGVFAARPYAREILRVLRSAAARMESTAHPLLERRPEERILVVVLTGDRSLAGAFNTNVIRRAMHLRARKFLEKDTGDRRGQEGPGHAEEARLDVRGGISGCFDAKWISRRPRKSPAKIAELYAKREVDAVYAVYNEFKNVMVQNLRVAKTAADRSGDPGGRSPEKRPAAEEPERSGAAARLGGQRQIPGRLHLRRAGRGDFQRPGAALSGSGSISHPAGIRGGGTRGAHDGHGFGYAERVGADRQADAGYE